MDSLTNYFDVMHLNGDAWGEGFAIHSCPELIAMVQRVGFLPLLDSGIAGFSAESLMGEECRYTVLADGSWDWPLWYWKGSVLRDGGCVYGKFFSGKAVFVSRAWWPDLCNWRRSTHRVPEEGTIEDVILTTLRENDSLISRDLRSACGFTGKNMRSKFDGYVTRLQMSCRIVTENFVYPTDKRGDEYGFGWSLLTTPECLLGRDACRCDRSAEESYGRMFEHLRRLLPRAPEKQIQRLLK